eukprot:12437713-Heterocapsa_arctica.AAC.1
MGIFARKAIRKGEKDQKSEEVVVWTRDFDFKEVHALRKRITRYRSMAFNSTGYGVRVLPGEANANLAEARLLLRPGDDRLSDLNRNVSPTL